MIQGILGKKIKMSRWFDSEGKTVPVTLLKCGPCYVVNKNGKNIQLGFEKMKEKDVKKPEAGYFKKQDVPSLKYLKEVKWSGSEDKMPEKGERIGAEVFKETDMVDIQGKSKGKGFTGVVKRWGFNGGRATHGSTMHRSTGSIGQSADPSRVFPGKKMAGRSGGEKVTEMNLEIVNVDEKENIIAVKGAVPGPNKGLIFIRKSKRANVR